MVLGAKTIKQIVHALGADLCGVASAESFHGAPEGFRPEDIFADCRSVIVFAKQFPASVLDVPSSPLYTHVYRVLSREVDRIGIELCLKLEEHGLAAIPIPADEAADGSQPGRPDGWGLMSLRHAGHLAGLGVLGKSTLLVNRDYGNMIHLGAVLTDIELEPDPLASYVACRPTCRICLDACPQQAVDGISVNHALCRSLSETAPVTGQFLIRCNKCRQVCPSHLGM